MRINKNNRVIVRVWTSEDNSQYPGEDALGHVSIEAKKDGDESSTYMSFWPSIPPTDAFTDKEKQEYKSANPVKRKVLSIKKYLKEVKADTEITFEDDCCSEKCLPQVTLCFYSLDPNKIINAFHDKKSDTNFRFWGTNLAIEELERVGRGDQQKADCCASFAYKLLSAGGLQVSSSVASRHSHSSYLSPDNLLPALIEAKQNEFKCFPNTRKFPIIRKEWEIDDKSYTEVELDLRKRNSQCKYYHLAMGVGLFAAGTAALVYNDMCPEVLSEYCDNAKQYFFQK